MGITVNGNIIVKGDQVFDGGVKIVKNYGGADESDRPLTDAELQEKIERVREQIGNTKRLWFSVCKYMMWRRMVADGDFVSAVAKLEELYPGLALDAADMSKLNVLSFRKKVDEWDINDAPVKNTTFSKYLSIAEMMDL